MRRCCATSEWKRRAGTATSLSLRRGGARAWVCVPGVCAGICPQARAWGCGCAGPREGGARELTSEANCFSLLASHCSLLSQQRRGREIGSAGPAHPPRMLTALLAGVGRRRCVGRGRAWLGRAAGTTSSPGSDHADPASLATARAGGGGAGRSPSAPPPPLPIEPGPEDCCNSGCDACVWAVYFRDLAAYQAWQRESGGQAGVQPPPPQPDAFAALEARLAAEERQRESGA